MSNFGERLNNISAEKQIYALQTLANHLTEARQEVRLHHLLTDFPFIETKIEKFEPQPLIQDYDLAFRDSPGSTEGVENGENSLRLIQGALRLAAHILAWDKAQLRSQLYCRLMSFQALDIQALLEQMRQQKSIPWLLSLTPGLTSPNGPLLRTLSESWLLYAVAVTPDGQTLVSASEEAGFKVWDLPRGEVLYTLRGHTNRIEDVAVVAERQRVISASDDYTLKVWSLNSRRELFTLQGHDREVRGVAVTPDGRNAVSVSPDGTLRVWDIHNGVELYTLSISTSPLYAVAVTPDGRNAICTAGDKAITLWDLQSRKKLYTFPPTHTSIVTAIAVTADGRKMISASNDYTLKVWDLENGKVLQTLEGHTDFVRAVAVTRDGRYAISASWDTSLRVWDLESGGVIAGFSGDGSLHACSVDTLTIVAGGALGQMYFLQLEHV